MGSMQLAQCKSRSKYLPTTRVFNCLKKFFSTIVDDSRVVRKGFVDVQVRGDDRAESQRSDLLWQYFEYQLLTSRNLWI